MLVIPAIDVLNGKCVRLTQGKFASKKVYRENPLEVAKEFEGSGLTHVHLVDLDGAHSGRVVNWATIESICTGTNLTIDVGGGIKTRDDVDRLLDIGVNQINLGSIAVKEPAMVHDWIKVYGDRIILSADVKGERIAIAGWQEDGSVNLFDFVERYLSVGIVFVTCTDIATDGTLGGPNIGLYKKLMDRFPAIKLTASGGVGSKSDLHELSGTGVYGTIIGKAIYEGKISLIDLKNESL